MKRSTIIGMLAGGYLGGALVWFTDLTVGDWQWWAILIPTLILFELKVSFKEESDQNRL